MIKGVFDIMGPGDTCACLMDQELTADIADVWGYMIEPDSGTDSTNEARKS